MDARGFCLFLALAGCSVVSSETDVFVLTPGDEFDPVHIGDLSQTSENDIMACARRCAWDGTCVVFTFYATLSVCLNAKLGWNGARPFNDSNLATACEAFLQNTNPHNLRTTICTMWYTRIKDPNIAVHKPTPQHSIRWNGDSRRAVDGIMTSKYDATPPSCSHTDRDKINPWWSVDLTAKYDIKVVALTNRGDLCCSKRLANFFISVDDAFPQEGLPYNTTTSKVCYSQIPPMEAGETRYFLCRQNLFGRFIVVSLVTTNNPLLLCEVKVYTGGRH